MTTSVNQPRPVTQVRSGGLFRAIGILALIVISVAWLLNSYNAGQPIKLSEPLPKSGDPVVEQTVTLSLALPERCMDVSRPVVRVAGSALKTPTDYTPCTGSSEPINTAYKATNGKDGYTLTDSDGDKLLCAAIPHEAADIAQCKALQ